VLVRGPEIEARPVLDFPTLTRAPLAEVVMRIGPWLAVHNVTGPADATPYDAMAHALARLRGTAALVRIGPPMFTNGERGHSRAALLAADDLEMAHLVAVTVVVASMADYADVNRAYAACFDLNPPTRSVKHQAPSASVPVSAPLCTDH
jgi:hypothetical protein